MTLSTGNYHISYSEENYSLTERNSPTSKGLVGFWEGLGLTAVMGGICRLITCTINSVTCVWTLTVYCPLVQGPKFVVVSEFLSVRL